MIVEKTRSALGWCALMLLANCGAIENAIERLEDERLRDEYGLSTFGLEFDPVDMSITGLSLTDAAQMPTSGVATYSGTTILYNLQTLDGSESVDQLLADFSSATVRLDVFGTEIGGRISGAAITNDTDFNGAANSMSGGFYGANADTVGVVMAVGDDSAGFIGSR